MGKRNKIFVCAAAFLFFAVFPLVSLAQEKIDGFDAKIKINADASIQVSERINYDFGAESRHGIFRDIPIKYQARGGNFNLRVSSLSVTDESGRPYVFKASVQGANEHLQIGDPGVLVSGKKVYVINYVIQRAINYFSDYDELYWNVTGNDWQVAMGDVSVAVDLPQAVSAKNLQIKCFAGDLGSAESCQAAAAVLSTPDNAEGASFAQPDLGPGQGLTIVIGFPKGLVAQPTAVQNTLRTISDNWVLVLPLLALGGMYYLWRKKGRDPEAGAIVAQYEAPEDLTPTEVGTIVDERADNQDVSAEIIELAVKGYIKITRLEKKVLFFDTADYQLEKLKEPADLPNKFQMRLMEGLFQGAGKTVMLSDLKNKFYQDLQDIKKQVYEAVVDKGIFARNPQTVRAVYMVLGIVVAALGVVLGIVAQQLFVILSLALSGIIVIIFGFFMPAKTLKGAQIQQEILGLKLYLSVAEKDRLSFHNAPEKSPQRFEKLLPFAMVLGVDAAWAKQFEGIYNQQPSWYSDPRHTAFNAILFTSALHNFSSSTNTALATRPSPSGGAAGGHSGFGGGGFSGGGFGGGGGGSW